MADQRTWLRRIDIALALAAVAALAYGGVHLPRAGEWGWGLAAAIGTGIVFAVPVAVVFGRRAHRLLLESPVLIPMALLLPIGTALVAAATGIAAGTWVRTRLEHRRNGTEVTLRTLAIFLPSVALQTAVGSRLEATGGELVFAAILLEVVHVAVVLPIPLLRARVNAPRKIGRWAQAGPSLAVAPLTALTAGAVSMLVVAHGPVGLAGYAPVLLLLAGGQRLSEAQQDRRRLDALYAMALDTVEVHHELERQDRIKTALLAAVGHDLQTPLAVQQGLADTLAMHRDELDPEQLEDLLGRIAANARRMSRTVSGLVDLERLELAGGEDGGCDAARAISAWAAEVDLPNGRFLDTVRVARQDDQVVVAVEDRGSGVPEAERERIFEALDQGTSRVRGSVGLGLFIVARLVEHAGGQVTVQDRDGGGASFRVHLPVRSRDGAGLSGGR